MLFNAMTNFFSEASHTAVVSAVFGLWLVEGLVEHIIESFRLQAQNVDNTQM